jgi:hypothetical protein
VPCEGSRIVHDGVEYRVSWSYIALGREVLDCPEWLLELVGNARDDRWFARASRWRWGKRRRDAWPAVQKGQPPKQPPRQLEVL